MSRTAWRTAGALALAHVALMLTAITQQQSPRLGEDPAAAYEGADLARVFAGGYLEALAFLLLLPVVAFLGRALGRRTETGRWAASTGVAAGVAYIASTLTVGLPAGAAAIYAAEHGADLATVAVVNDVRNFAFFLSMLLLAVHVAGVAVALLADRLLPRWLGWSGLGTAVVLVGTVPFAVTGAVDYATLVWILWFIALATAMLRHRPEGAAVPTRAAVTTTAV
jgi:hypothetical protein